MVTMVLLVVVGLLWGVTNPFIRVASQGIEKIETGSRWRNLLLELRTVGTRLSYWIPFLLNQCGSVVYIYVLQSTSIVVAVPVANSLAFVFTAITGYLLGERIPGKKIILGTLMVSIGSTLLLYDKTRSETETIQLV